jgi:dCMP deaminase
LIYQAGISRLVFLNRYKDSQGLDFLQQAGVEISQLDEALLGH